MARSAVIPAATSSAVNIRGEPWMIIKKSGIEYILFQEYVLGRANYSESNYEQKENRACEKTKTDIPIPDLCQ
nr:hypothetical protein HmN_000274900 [Hymenolepis microstoma]